MIRGIHRTPHSQSIHFGRPASEVLPEVMQAIGASRVLLVTNSSLAAAGGLAESIRAAVGDRCVGLVTGLRAHVPKGDVLRVASEIRDTVADSLVAVGGGSVCDAAKVARLAFANEAFDDAALDALRSSPNVGVPRLHYVMIPTTLSAGEFTSQAGVLNEQLTRKETFRYPRMAPDTVIFDPELPLHTPHRLWASTGLRAVDHAIETWCAPGATPLSDATSLHALRLLVAGLSRISPSSRDSEAISSCQAGAWLSAQGLASGMDMGASHAIGHALGSTCGMPHGETSCVILPHVLRFNGEMNAHRQAELAKVMDAACRPIAETVANLVHDLGLPSRLRDAGINRSSLPSVANAAMRDRWLPTNPRVMAYDDVRELLERAW